MSDDFTRAASDITVHRLEKGKYEIRMYFPGEDGWAFIELNAAQLVHHARSAMMELDPRAL